LVEIIGFADKPPNAARKAGRLNHDEQIPKECEQIRRKPKAGLTMSTI
jgi:hypothetical protein